MKSNIKVAVITAIITAVICISTTAYAAYAINASNVLYTDKNNNQIQLNEAIDHLYENLDSKMVLNTFGTSSYQSSQGTPMTVRTTSKSINKGKYLILVSTGEGWNDGGTYAASQGENNKETLSCSSNNCTINRLSGYGNSPKATDPITSNYRAMISSIAQLYYVEIIENTDQLIGKATAAANYTTGAQFVTIQVIPID